MIRGARWIHNQQRTGDYLSCFMPNYITPWQIVIGSSSTSLPHITINQTANSKCDFYLRENQCDACFLFILLICINPSVLKPWYSGIIRARFLSLARIKLRLCSATHQAGYFSNLSCEWMSIGGARSEQETEKGPWSIPWPMMPWCIASPGHQQPWCYLCGVSDALSFLR